MDPDAELIRKAAQTTIDAGTMRFHVEVLPTEAAEGVPATTSRGQVSFADRMQFRYLAHAFTGLGGTSPEYEVIFDDPRIYLRGREALPDEPDTWVLFDFDLLGSGEIIRKRYVSQHADVLLILTPALGVVEAELEGQERLRSDTLSDVAATHYSAVASVDVPSESLPSSARDVYRDRLAALRASEAPRTFEVDIWIDAQGRIVRISSAHDIESEAIDVLTVTYEMTSFGAAMDLNVPEGAEVLTIDQLQDRVRGSATPSPLR